MNDKTINQPTTAEQKTLDDVLENSIDYITIRGKKFGIKWLHNWWKIRLFHWIYWRMLWKKYTDDELYGILFIGKKKVEFQRLEYLNAFTLLTGMRDTIMTMTRKEAERILQELRQEQHLQTEKNTQS